MIDLAAQTPAIAPSILSADFGRLVPEAQSLENMGIGILHLDVMDGHFVPNLTFGPAVVGALRRETTAVLDAHLMVETPETMVPWFAEAGADWLTLQKQWADHVLADASDRP